jgi:hypothetical protein
MAYDWRRQKEFVSKSIPFSLIGAVGLTVVGLLNVFGLLVLEQPAAHFFNGSWWSTWLPSYVAWTVFLMIGLSRTHAAKRDL